MHALPLSVAVLLVCAVSGCTSTGQGGSSGTRPQADGPPLQERDVTTIADAVPRVEPRARYGNMASYVVFGKRYYTLDDSAGYSERGLASWYGRKFHGRKTSSGEPYDMWAMTAAHRSLPLPTFVRVTNLENGRSVVVKVNDRGPFHGDRIIDLSYAAAKKLDMIGAGTTRVEVVAIDPTQGSPAPAEKTRSVSATAPRTPAPPAGTERTGFYVQAGAYQSQANAEVRRSQLEAAGLDSVFVLSGADSGGVLHRVRVGPYSTRAEANRRAQHLNTAGLAPAAVIVN